MRDQAAALEAAVEVLRVQVEALQLETNQLCSDLAAAQQRLSCVEFVSASSLFDWCWLSSGC